MTTPTAWAHLPNAKHIDAVLADVNTRPEVWKAAWGAARSAAWDAAWDAAWAAARDAAWAAARDAARDAARGEAWGAAWDAAWDAARGAAWGAARGAAWWPVAALIAWDSAADLLDLPADVLRTMADLAPAPVCHQAVLLLPWALVRETT